MELRNPLFKSMDRDTYEGSEATCTIHGTFGKTLMLLLITIATAIGAIAFLNNITDDNITTFVGLLLASFIVALIACLVCTFSVRLCPVFSIIFITSCFSSQYL